MFRIDKDLQRLFLPEGYEIITEGVLQPGDIRWNLWLEEWNTKDVTQSPKHDIVIGDQIKSFPGVCRKITSTKNEKNEELLAVCQL